jgi:hypothetical protein
MKTILAVFLFGLFCPLAYSQPADSLWTHRYGSSGNEWAYAAGQTTDGGFIVAGSTTSFNSYNHRDFWLLKTDSTGDSLWSRHFGGRLLDDAAYAVAQAGDGGYLVAGYFGTSYSYYTDAIVMKTTADGDSVWSRQFGGLAHGAFTSIAKTTDGNYLLAGNRQITPGIGCNLWLVKMNEAGDSLWSRLFDYTAGRQTFSVTATRDGGALLTGWYHGGCHSVLLRIDSAGDTLWTRHLLDLGDNHPYCVRQTADGGFILSGSANYDTDRNGLIVKTDSLGNILWQRDYGRSRTDEFFSVQPIPTGGYLLAGFSLLNNTLPTDYWILRTNEQGDSVWSGSFGGAGTDTARVIVPTSDGNFLVVGSRTFDDSCGTDFWLMKLELAMPSSTPTLELQPEAFALSAYPNPFNPSTEIAYSVPNSGRIHLSVYDILGQRISVLQDGLLSAGEYRFTFDGGRYPSGIYFLRLETVSYQKTLKLVLMK